MTQRAVNIRKVSSHSDYFTIQDNKLVLGRKFTPLPSNITNKILDLFIYFSKQELEVLVYLNKDFLNNYVVTVPRQVISKDQVIVENSLNQRNILNGTITLPLTRFGSFHSHHKMSVSFSPEDDRSDFSQGPGFHYLFRNYPDIRIDCSGVYNNTRYFINPTDAIFYEDKHKYKGIDKTLNRIIQNQITLK